MGRVYVVSQLNVSLTSTPVLMELNTPSDAMVRIISIHLGQSSDPGDAEDELIPLVLQRMGSSGGTGTTLTPRPVHIGHGSAGTTVDGNVGGQGAPQLPLYTDFWSVRSGYHHEPTPLGMIWVQPSDFFAFRITGSPNDELTVNYSMVFEEFD